MRNVINIRYSRAGNHTTYKKNLRKSLLSCYYSVRILFYRHPIFICFQILIKYCKNIIIIIIYA
jgi:hypothetical protein